MSDKKWDKEDLDELELLLLEDVDEYNEEEDNQILSGSNQSNDSEKVEVQIKSESFETVPVMVRKSNIPFPQIKKRKEEPKSLIIPIEEWPTQLTSTELKAYKEYQRSQWPELFEVKGVENDKSSDVPFLKLTRSARIFASLLESATKIKNKEKDFKKNKKGS